ncbi:hypothetical protein HYV84_04610 [Candidatus Woesearchaeota archaeon]|nr:hypothetical protein [Candidatus Woesearchaeota archaeon]
MALEQEIKEKYLELRKKYALPGFDELNNDFVIVMLAEGKTELVGSLLVAVRHRMTDAFNAILNYLHGLFIPVPNFMVSMKEHEALDESDHRRLYQAIARLNLLVRKSWKVSIRWKDEKEDAVFIKESFKEFQLLKKEIEYFIDKNIQTWEKVLDEKPQQPTHGHAH